MIRGLGVDLCSVSRMQRAIRSRHFVERIFRSAEIRYADGKDNDTARAASYAAAFAAREAFAKASGISMYTVALSSSICLERNKKGAPFLFVPAELASQFLDWHKGQVLVSLSHEGDYAVAVVIIESD